MSRGLRLRLHDGLPTASEIGFHLVIWTVLFEVIGPHLIRVTGDVRDAAAYAVGAMLMEGRQRWHRHGGQAGQAAFHHGALPGWKLDEGGFDLVVTNFFLDLNFGLLHADLWERNEPRDRVHEAATERVRRLS